MIKSRYTMKKYEGDDKYSWAVFKDGKPILTGESRHLASYYLKMFRKEEKQRKEVSQNG